MQMHTTTPVYACHEDIVCRLRHFQSARQAARRLVTRCCSTDPQPQTAQQQDGQLQHIGGRRHVYKDPDFSKLPERLQRQWDRERSTSWSRPVVAPGSDQLAWWCCDCCPAGHQHRWPAAVEKRVKESGNRCCPFKSSRRVCKHCNSLAAKYPVVAEEWDKESNPPSVTPEPVTAYAITKAHWICGSCGHKWQAVIANRTRLGRGCRVCNQRGGGGTAYKYPCLAVFAREKGLGHLFDEWDTKHNLEKGWTLEYTQPMSNRRVYWVNYENCPKGQPHHWTARVHHRVHHRSNDPIQAGKQACVCNLLASLYQGVAAQLHPSINGNITASQIVAGSFKRYWWIDNQQRMWQQSPDSRTKGLAPGCLHAPVPSQRQQFFDTSTSPTSSRT